MQAIEAHAALRAAEIATKAALEAQAEARAALEEFTAATLPHLGTDAENDDNAFDEPFFTEDAAPVAEAAYRTPAPRIEEPARYEAAPRYQEPLRREERSQSYDVRWEETLPERTASAAAPAQAAENWAEENRWAPEVVEPVTPIQAGPANLIEFPREIIAPHKARPRRAEQHYQEQEQDPQLSIFEVDPEQMAALETPSLFPPDFVQPTLPVATAEPVVEHQPVSRFVDEPVAVESVRVFEELAAQVVEQSAAEVALPSAPWVAEPANTQPQLSPWKSPIWSDLEFDEESIHEELNAEEARAAEVKQPIELASFGRRLLATTVDITLISAVTLAAGFGAFHRLDPVPTLRAIEICSGAAFALVALAYEVLLMGLFGATIGMKYASLRLRTFDDRNPHVAEIHLRLLGLGLSILPAGLGLAWFLFDEDHLSWHDRISRTYLRKR